MASWNREASGGERRSWALGQGASSPLLCRPGPLRPATNPGKQRKQPWEEVKAALRDKETRCLIAQRPSGSQDDCLHRQWPVVKGGMGHDLRVPFIIFPYATTSFLESSPNYSAAPEIAYRFCPDSGAASPGLKGRHMVCPSSRFVSATSFRIPLPAFPTGRVPDRSPYRPGAGPTYKR